MLSVSVLSIITHNAECGRAEYGHAECEHARCGHAECGHAECRNAECGHAECGYAECGYAESGHAEYYQSVFVVLSVSMLSIVKQNDCMLRILLLSVDKLCVESMSLLC
jgi:hypothetical protein